MPNCPDRRRYNMGIPGSDNRNDSEGWASTNRANHWDQNAFEQNQATNQGLGVLSSQLGGMNYYGNASQVYGQQQQAAQMLQNQANGTAPSAAQIQMGLGLGQANQQAQSAALSQQGGVLSGNTQRNMLNAQAMNSQNVLGQSSALRAQEQMSGQQAYAALLSQMQQQQQQQGQYQYQQGQNNLNYQSGLAQNMFGNALTNSNQQYQNTQGNIAAQTGASQAGAGQLAGILAAGGQAAATIGTAGANKLVPTK